MQYRDNDVRYDSENDEIEAESVRQQVEGKQYRRKSSARAARRGSTKSSDSNPGCGIGARRKPRWNW